MLTRLLFTRAKRAPSGGRRLHRLDGWLSQNPCDLSGASAGLPRSLRRLAVVGSVYLGADGLAFEQELLGQVLLAAFLVYQGLVALRSATCGCMSPYTATYTS